MHKVVSYLSDVLCQALRAQLRRSPRASISPGNRTPMARTACRNNEPFDPDFFVEDSPPESVEIRSAQICSACSHNWFWTCIPAVRLWPIGRASHYLLGGYAAALSLCRMQLALHPCPTSKETRRAITKLFSPAFMHSEISPDCGMACLGDLIKFKVHSFIENRNN